MDSSSKEDVGAKVQGVCDTQRGLRMRRLPREPESRRERQRTPFTAWRRQSAAHGGERPNLCRVTSKAIRQGSHNKSARWSTGIPEYLEDLPKTPGRKRSRLFGAKFQALFSLQS